MIGFPTLNSRPVRRRMAILERELPPRSVRMRREYGRVKTEFLRMISKLSRQLNEGW